MSQYLELLRYETWEMLMKLRHGMIAQQAHYIAITITIVYCFISI